MHWAAHGHTVAELIFERVDSNKDHLGLTHFIGGRTNKGRNRDCEKLFNRRRT